MMVDSTRVRAIAIFSVVIVSLLPSRYPIMDDEFFTWWACRHGLTDLLRIATEDVHPPMYYLLVRGWSFCLGDSISVLRSFSGLCSFLSIIGAGLLYVSLPGCGHPKHGLTPRNPHFIWLLLAINGVSVYYAHWARMYAWMGLLGVITVHAAMQCLQTPERRSGWLLLTVTSALLMSTHHYSTIFAAALYGWLFLELIAKYRLSHVYLRALIFSIAVCGVLATPTLLVAIRQASEVHASYWITDAGFSAPAIGLLGYFLPIETVAIPLEGSLLAIAALLLICFAPRRLSAFERMFVCQLAAVAVVVFVARFFGGRPIFVPRYLHTLHPLACIFVMTRFDSLSWKPVSRGLKGLFLANTICCSVAVFCFFTFGQDSNTHKQNDHAFREGNLLLREMTDENTSIVCLDPKPFLRYHYYAGAFSRNVVFWNPDTVALAKTEHQVFLSAIPPYIRLSNEQIQGHEADKLIIVDDHNANVDVPGWHAVDPQPEFHNPLVKIKAFVRASL